MIVFALVCASYAVRVRVRVRVINAEWSCE